MTLKKNALLFAFSLTAILGCLIVESESHAQHFRRRPPGQELGRFLGLGYGNGYHCRTPGPQTDYYNPYSAMNSHLVSRYQDAGGYSNLNTGYAVGGGAVPHSVYTGTSNEGHSVFESVPGQTMTPSFEPVPERKPQFRRDLEERDFEDELDLEDNATDEGDTNEDGFGSRLRDDQESAINRELEDEEGDGGFDALRDNIENLDSEGGSGSRDSQPTNDDQASFFGDNTAN